MKIRTLVAATAIAATGAIGAVAQSQSASAGCGLSITVDNDEPTTVTVNWTLSKVRAKVLGVPGTWASLGSSSTNVGEQDAEGDSDEYTKAVTAGFGCGNERQYKIHVSDGTNTWWEYFPSSSTWTNDESPFIDLNR